MSTDWRFCADSPRDAALLIDEQRQELAALRARVATLEGDLNVARLQLGARVCSECPAKEGVAELAQLLDEGSAYVHSFAMLSKHPTAPAYARDLAQRMRSATGLSGNKEGSRE